MNGTTAANGLQEHEKINASPVIEQTLKNDETEQTATEDVQDDHVKALVHTSNVRDFIRYIRQFKTDTAYISYSQGEDITVVFDYHQMKNGQLVRGHCDHVNILKLQTTPEYHLWKRLSNNRFSQMEFAELLMRFGNCLVSTDPAELFNLVSNIRIRKTIEYGSKINLASAKGTVLSSENSILLPSDYDGLSKDGSVVEQLEKSNPDFPSNIEISVPVYLDYEEKINLQGTLHYHLFDNNDLKFWAIFDGADQKERDTFDKILELTRQAMAE